MLIAPVLTSLHQHGVWWKSPTIQRRQSFCFGKLICACHIRAIQVFVSVDSIITMAWVCPDSQEQGSLFAWQPEHQLLGVVIIAIVCNSASRTLSAGRFIGACSHRRVHGLFHRVSSSEQSLQGFSFAQHLMQDTWQCIGITNHSLCVYDTIKKI